MANKKDLAEAQNYSRARLITAFTSGIPGGKELAPKKGLTPVLVGVGLTAIMVLVSVFYGYLSPGLPTDWSNNRLIVAKDTASRFVSVKGTLYPVINTTSARLLIPSKDYKVLVVDDQELEGLPVGNSVGIAGAPDILPNRDRLANRQFASCAQDDAVRNVISAQEAARPAGRSTAVVVSDGGTEFVIAAGLRHRLPKDGLTRDSMLRILGLAQAQVTKVATQWVNLFGEGTPLDPVHVPGEGKTIKVEGESYEVGSFVTQQGGDGSVYVVMQDASLAPVDGVAKELYSVGKDDSLIRPHELTVAKLGGFSNAPASFIPADWPNAKLTAMASPSPCALTEPSDGADGTAATPSVELGTVPDRSLLDATPAHTKVASGSGALVRAVSGDDITKGTLYVIDGSGMAYPVPDDTEEIIARLGFQSADVRGIPREWVDVFAIGVSLSPDDAGLPAQFNAAGTSTANTGTANTGTTNSGTGPTQ